MTEKGWLRSANARPMLELLWSTASDRQLRLFACGCARRVWHLLADAPSREAVETAERFADGLADLAELRRACEAAHEAQQQIERGTRDDAADMAACVAVDAARPRADFRSPPLGPDDFTAATDAAHCTAAAVEYAAHAASADAGRARKKEEKALANVVRDMFGNPFRAVRFLPSWRPSTVLALAKQMYEARDFSAMPILADALQDAGCNEPAILDHCRDPKQVHVRGCWVVDLVVGKE